MLANYFKILFRNLIRNSTYSIINILGLSVGVSVCLIILEYVKFERSYDRFHPESSTLYRVILGTTSAGVVNWDAANFAPAGPALKNDFSAVTDFTRITPEYFGIVCNLRGNIFEEKKVFYADSNHFNFFGYRLLVGDPATALLYPRSIVFSLSTAEKYLGPKNTWKENPLGQIILVNNKETYSLTGIMEDTPANSHLKFNALISYSTFLQKNNPTDNWGWNDFYTYIRLNSSDAREGLQSQLTGFIRRHQKNYKGDVMTLQPVEDVHLHSNVGYELEVNGSAQTVSFLSIIALAILIIAWVNYVNLATARAEKRAKEIGVRKVSGASRRQLISQLLLESFLMNFIAVSVALVAVAVTLPSVGNLLGKPLQFSMFSDYNFLGSLALLYVTGSILSGIYPAVVLSAFRPMDIFKPASTRGSGGRSILRRSLVTLQFIVSITLITGTIIVSNQLRFMKQKDLGFNHDMTLVLNSPRTAENEMAFLQQYRQFKQSMLTFPNVERVTISSSLPGKLSNDLDTNGPIKMLGQDDSFNRSFAVFRVDQDFLEAFKMKMAAGHFYSSDHPMTDKQLIGDAPDDVVVINRKAAELLGYADPSDIIGKKLSYSGNTKEIIGVVENYHHKSLKNNFEPIILRNRISSTLYISIRLTHADDLQNTIGEINNIWKTSYAGSPFVFSFLQDDVNNHYLEDERFNKVFIMFSVFSILIGSLGLFGLVSYSVVTRLKEIGIRKVLGASISSIMILFSKEFFRLIVAALIIGVPLAWYFFDLWLANFAYRATLSVWMFVIPVLVVSLFSILSIFTQLMKAALMNPVDALRNE